jgi:hypothetical protein
MTSPHPKNRLMWRIKLATEISDQDARRAISEVSAWLWEHQLIESDVLLALEAEQMVRP